MLTRTPGHGKYVSQAQAQDWEENKCCAHSMTLLLPSARYTCPFVEKFSIEIETYYLPDGGQQPNVFNLNGAERRQRILGEAFLGPLPLPWWAVSNEPLVSSSCL